jgi:hypothetical protein
MAARQPGAQLDAAATATSAALCQRLDGWQKAAPAAPSACPCASFLGCNKNTTQQPLSCVSAATPAHFTLGNSCAGHHTRSRQGNCRSLCRGSDRYGAPSMHLCIAAALTPHMLGLKRLTHMLMDQYITHTRMCMRDVGAQRHAAAHTKPQRRVNHMQAPAQPSPLQACLAPAAKGACVPSCLLHQSTVLCCHLSMSYSLVVI